MALHWEELKGFYGEIAGGGDLLYTYIRFQKEASSATTTNEISRPTISLKKNGSTEISLGYILCNNVENYIEKAMTFHNQIILGDNNFSGAHDSYNFILKWNKNATQQYLIFQDNTTSTARNFLTITPVYLWMKNAGIELDTTQTATGTGNGFGVTCNFASFDLSGSDKYFRVFSTDTAVKLLHVGLADNNQYFYRFTSSAIYSTNPIHAYYFDATSDKRAKENINPLTSSALKIVNQTPIYTFNYKKNQQASVGILAQDIQDINLNGFNLVDNRDATGENEDYMQIHESKLVYVLWKAVQELSSEVENLKKQLNK